MNLVVITNKASNILEERSNAAMRSRLDLSHVVVVDTCSAHVASQMSDVLEDLETLRLLAKAFDAKIRAYSSKQVQARASRFGSGLRAAARSYHPELLQVLARTFAMHGANPSGGAGLLRDPGLRGERGTTRLSEADEWRGAERDRRIVWSS